LDINGNKEIQLKYPCKNILCKLNKCGACDAEFMINLMCSARDLYNACEEKEKGEDILRTLKNLTDKKLVKNRKGQLKYDIKGCSNLSEKL